MPSDYRLSPNVITENLENTLKAFEVFASVKGIKYVKSLGSPENKKIFHVWAGNTIGADKFSFEAVEEEWSKSLVGLLENDTKVFDEVKNTVLYFGSEECRFEGVYTNSKQLLECIDKQSPLEYSDTDFREASDYSLFSAIGTPLVNWNGMSTFYPPFEKIVKEFEDKNWLKEPHVRAHELVMYRVCAKIEAGLYDSNTKLPRDIKLITVYHNTDTEVDWALREHAAKTADRPFQEYLDAWFNQV
jgi:hypothetical protein